MLSKSHGPLNLLKNGPLPTLALVAATLAPAAQAQVRARAGRDGEPRSHYD